MEASETPRNEEMAEERRTWMDPVFNKIDMGEAEGADGVGGDGGLIS